MSRSRMSTSLISNKWLSMKPVDMSRELNSCLSRQYALLRRLSVGGDDHGEAPQHLLPGGRYPLPGPDSHRLERASSAWRTSH